MYEVHTLVYTVHMFVCTIMCGPAVGVFRYHSLPYCFEEELFCRMASSPCWLDFPANELLGSAHLCLLGSSYSYTESGPHC